MRGQTGPVARSHELLVESTARRYQPLVNRRDRRAAQAQSRTSPSRPASDVEEQLRAALASHQAGNVDAAIQTYQQILRAYPKHPAAMHFLGLAMQQRGNLERGIQLMVEAVTLAPHEFSFHSNLGNAYLSAGNLDGAIKAFDGAVRLKPQLPELWRNLGVARARKGDADGAERAYREALGLRGDYVDAHVALGVLLLGSGKPREAEPHFARAAELAPNVAVNHDNLANALAAQGKFEEAVLEYQRAIELDPQYAEAINNLGNTLREMHRLDDAESAYRRALVLRPELAVARNNLATVVLQLGRAGEAVAEYRRALADDPTFTRAHANLLLAMQSDPATTSAELAREHRAFGARVESGLAAPAAFPNDRDPARKLRVGYVSADLREHSVAYFIEAVLAHHDRNAFEVFVYYSHHQDDRVTERLQRLVDHWRPTAALPEPDFAARVREDRIDVLFDLSGHSAQSRLLAFALKPAPVQFTWIGYPDTTGMSRIDYRIVDSTTDPADADARSVERLVRVDPCFLCYSPPAALPPVAPAPCLASGRVTFGSFNALHKIDVDVLETWTRILRAVPGSRLVMKSSALGSASARTRVLEVFARADIPADRVDLRAWVADPRAHLSTYDEIDIALDTHPYNGTTTICEALWMGVPTVTRLGDRHASRVGASLVRAAGLGDWVATGPEEYVELAVSRAKDPAALAELRAGLRARASASALGDGAAFTRRFEAMLRDRWAAWCATTP